jgi:hypothetical protein
VEHVDHDKLLFKAKSIDETICIKFVRYYSKEVHELCAENSFAPALKGFDKLPGEWYMIVIEMIGDDYYCLKFSSSLFLL